MNQPLSGVLYLEKNTCPEPNSGCLLWTGTLHTGGYGHASRDGKKLGAHRLVWQIHNGAIPRGMVVRHTCDNPPCCNIEHLRLGTPKDNSLDMVARGRACRGSGVWNAKLTESAVLEIHRLRLLGVQHKEIARRLGVVRTVVTRVIGGKLWAHVHPSEDGVEGGLQTVFGSHRSTRSPVCGSTTSKQADASDGRGHK